MAERFENSSLQNYNETHVENVKTKRVKDYDIIIIKQI